MGWDEAGREKKKQSEISYNVRGAMERRSGKTIKL